MVALFIVGSYFKNKVEEYMVDLIVREEVFNLSLGQITSCFPWTTSVKRE